jgi:3-oxoacyl-[acyl-carrier-protein] synthase-1
MKHNVAVTAVGLLNALGTGLDQVAENLFRGEQSGIISSERYIPQRTCFVAPVRGEVPNCPPNLADVWSRNAALSLAALTQIKAQVRAVIARYGGDRVGVVMGSSTSGIEEGELAVRARRECGVLPKEYCYPQQQMGSVSEVIARVTGAKGPAYTISTACSSSAKIFRAGLNLIEAEWCDAVIVGGFDSLCKLTTNGFSALELVSDEVTNPFSKNRKGITIGEGGALFILERASQQELSERMVYVAGVGESSDAYHISSPDPSGAGAVTAIRAAISQAGITPDQIDYINLHGTGTLHNDSMEARAIRAIFSEHVPCSSTKPLVGHMLGASGATEAAFCFMAMMDDEGRLPPHMFDGVMDLELPPLNLVPPGAKALAPVRYALSNSFGFGGSNCAVVLRRGPR